MPETENSRVGVASNRIMFMKILELVHDLQLQPLEVAMYFEDFIWIGDHGSTDAVLQIGR
jgi:hypothetical protein